MKNMFLIFSVSLLSFLVVISPVKIRAQALSDLSTQSLDEVMEDEERRAPINPFAATGVSAAEDLTIEDLILAGTITSNIRSYALISGYLVAVGDRIAGFNIDQIEKGKVVLRRVDEVYVLTMGGL